MAGATRPTPSRQSTPDDLLNGESYDTNSIPRVQLVKTAYPPTLSDETLFDLGILSNTHHLAQPGLAMNLQFVGPQYLLPPAKEESLELEDYIQGLNDRFDLPGDQLLPMTPRCSFEHGESARFRNCDVNLKRVDGPLRTDNTLIQNLSPPTQSGLLPSPATSDLTPPHAQVQDIYAHALSTTSHLKDIAIPPPFVQKTPMGPLPYNPRIPVFVQGVYASVTPQRNHNIQTASMADITSSPITHQRFPTPPLSQQGELLHSPTFPQNRPMSPHDIASYPERHTSPDSDLSGTNSTYGSPQRRPLATFDTPPFSPQFAPQLFGAHLQARRRGHLRGYSTTSIMSTATLQTDASSPPSSDEEGAYINDVPVKSRGTRVSNIPDATMQSYIAGPDPLDHKYQCLFPDCGKKFGRKYNIQSHIQTHLSDRPYRCEICRSGFVRQHDLRRHEKIHGGDKPFVCACRKCFARQDALTRHRQRGICIGAFPEAREQRIKHDQMKRHQRRNSIAI